MAAAVSIRICTSTDAGTVSASVSGIDFISADNATNTTANRQSNPITAGSHSYEKWIKAYVDTAPDNGCAAFKIWGDGAVQGSTDLFVGISSTGVTPVNTDSSVATNDFTSSTVDNKLSWHSTALTATAATTDHVVFQLDIDATKGAGNWTQETVSWSYDET